MNHLCSQESIDMYHQHNRHDHCSHWIHTHLPVVDILFLSILGYKHTVLCGKYLFLNTKWGTLLFKQKVRENYFQYIMIRQQQQQQQQKQQQQLLTIFTIGSSKILRAFTSSHYTGAMSITVRRALDIGVV